MNVLLFCLFLVTSFTLSVKADYKYTTEKLRMMDGDRLKKIVNKKISDSRKIKSDTMVTKEGDSSERESSGVADANEDLRDALRIVLARPVQDGIGQGFLESFRGELTEDDGYAKALAQLAGEATRIVKDDSAVLKQQNTALTILENILAEIRPQAKKSEIFKTIVQSIADAGISIRSELQNYKELNSMEKPISPSKTAKEILKELPPKKK